MENLNAIKSKHVFGLCICLLVMGLGILQTQFDQEQRAASVKCSTPQLNGSEGSEGLELLGELEMSSECPWAHHRQSQGLCGLRCVRLNERSGMA